MMNFFKKDKFALYNGMKLTEIQPGYAIAELEINENHMNAVGTVQGGAIFTLADFAFAAAANSHGFMTLGINANISYFKSPEGKTLTAKATEIAISRKLCCCNVDVFDESKELVARFTGNGYIKKSKLDF